MSKSALSPHVKQSEKKILNPDSDPDQQNSAKLFKSPHKDAAYKISQVHQTVNFRGEDD